MFAIEAGKTIFLASTFMILSTGLASANEPRTIGPASAPPKVCEIRQRAWCIYQEGAEITDTQRIDNDDPGDHTWILKDVRSPNSSLVIFEPDGCRIGFSDTVKAMEYTRNVKWKGRLWDQMQIGLRSDGSCDLKLLISPYDGNPLEWAFSTGRVLLAACSDEKCTPIMPTPADVTDKYIPLFKRQDIKSSR
jgi:hypothetical protein